MGSKHCYTIKQLHEASINSGGHWYNTGITLWQVSVYVHTKVHTKKTYIHDNVTRINIKCDPISQNESYVAVWKTVLKLLEGNIFYIIVFLFSYDYFQNLKWCYINRCTWCKKNVILLYLICNFSLIIIQISDICINSHVPMATLASRWESCNVKNMMISEGGSGWMSERGERHVEARDRNNVNKYVKWIHVCL